VASNEKREPRPVPDGDPQAGVAGFGELLEGLKTRIRDAQIRATLAVNRELLSL
jgi:hypothetical protein